MSDYPKIQPEISQPISENLQKLADLFPAAVKDGELDVEALREELGDFAEIQPGDEKYELNWVGKQAAKKKTFEPLLGKTLALKDDGKNADTTENLYIEGDNLEALKLLRQNYYGEVKMIYIDPPYNTGEDFVYSDKYTTSKTESDESEGIANEEGDPLQKNDKSSNRYHARWLDMIYPRLRLAKDLLRQDGVILIHIDEHELANLLRITDEIFGNENRLGEIIWDKKNPKGDANKVATQHEYIVCYSKSYQNFKATTYPKRPKENAERMLRKAKSLFGKLGKEVIPDDLKKACKKYDLDLDLSEFKKTISREDISTDFKSWLSNQDVSGGEAAYKHFDKTGQLFQPVSMAWPNNKQAPDEYFEPLFHPVTNLPCPVPEKGWRNPPSTMKSLLDDNRIIFGEDETTQPRNKYLLSENMMENVPSVVRFGASDDALFKSMGLSFDNPKPFQLACNLISWFADGTDGVFVDFFSGSSTTGHAVMHQNSIDGGKRKHIMVQWPEACDKKSAAYKAGYKMISEIGKERIRRTGDKIIEELRAERAKLEAKGKLEEESNPYILDPDSLDIGFKSFSIEDTKINWLKKDLRGEDLEAEAGLTTQDALDFVPGFTDTDIVYELMLRQSNIPLTLPITQPIDGSERTYLYGDSYLICLEETISKELVEQLAALEPTPLKYFFRDSAFGKDIAFKDETFRRLNAEIAKNTADQADAYTVEFI